MLPIARWLQRRAVWLAGCNEDSLETFLEDNNALDVTLEPAEFEVEVALPEEFPDDLLDDAIGDNDGGGDDCVDQDAGDGHLARVWFR